MGAPRHLGKHQGHRPLPSIAQTFSPGSPKPPLRRLPRLVTSSWCQSMRLPWICRYTSLACLQTWSPSRKDTSGEVGAAGSYLRICIYNHPSSNAQRRRARAQRAGGTMWHNYQQRFSKRTETTSNLMCFDLVMVVSHFKNRNNKTDVLNA